jgi:hypothetical protein
VLVAAVLSLGGGAMALSHAAALWQVLLADMLMALGWAGASSMTISITLSQHFAARRGRLLRTLLPGSADSHPAS